MNRVITRTGTGVNCLVVPAYGDGANEPGRTQAIHTPAAQLKSLSEPDSETTLRFATAIMGDGGARLARG